jgi:AraC-like DNA-binding protein
MTAMLASALASARTTRLSTSAVDDRDGFEYWKNAVSSTFVPLECRTDVTGVFRGELVNVTLGDIQLTRIAAASHQVQRTRRAIGSNDPGLLKVALQIRGTGRISQDGHEAKLGPGDLTLYDTTRPYTLRYDDNASFETFILMFPAQLLGLPRDSVRAVTALRISGQDGVGALVSPFLAGLAELTSQDNPVLSCRLAHNVIALLETLYLDRLDLAATEPERVSTVRLLAIQGWLDRRLDDPELTPETIAAAHHISLRYLHRLFAAEETSVSRWVKERRLEGCRRDLADPALVRFSVAALAARWGLLDAAGFSRSFRSAYGLSPREYRMRSLSPRSMPTGVAPRS